METLKNYVDNQWKAASATDLIEVLNPATGEGLVKVPLSQKQEVDEATQAASRALPGWRATPVTERIQFLFKYKHLLEEKFEELARGITIECGKTLDEARGELRRGIENVEVACGTPSLIQGYLNEDIAPGIDELMIRQPVGVVAIISPFNFPAMVPLWFVPIAIACGNAVVIKPSEKDPSAVNAVAKLWQEAGLPEGVMNVVHGDKEAVDALLEHDDVKAVSFVGSTPIAKYVYETATANGKRVQALGGAKNHMLVLPDADLDLAADAAINAGFGSAGERCMAISALIAVEPIADELIDKIKERMAKLRTGDGTRNPDMGPLVTKVHRDKVASYLDLGVEAGAELLVDGREGDIDADGEGFFLRPTLFDKAAPGMPIYDDEIFGPVLSVVRVGSYDEGLKLINDNPYGNGTAIFTNDGGAARRFQNEVEVGMVGINVPIPVPVSFFSFGGWKASLFGDSHAYGMEGVHFYTRGKVITSRWLDPSHAGINLGFPQNS